MRCGIHACRLPAPGCVWAAPALTLSPRRQTTACLRLSPVPLARQVPDSRVVSPRWAWCAPTAGKPKSPTSSASQRLIARMWALQGRHAHCQMRANLSTAAPSQHNKTHVAGLRQRFACCWHLRGPGSPPRPCRRSGASNKWAHARGDSAIPSACSAGRASPGPAPAQTLI